MSSSSATEDEKEAILNSIALSADAVIKSQKLTLHANKHRIREADADSMDLNVLQQKLRKALDQRLEISVMPRFKKAKRKGRQNGLDEAEEKSEADGGVRLFRKVPSGTPAILETQSRLREKAEDESRLGAARMCAVKRKQCSSSSSSEDEMMKKNLEILSVDTSFIVKTAEAARQKAAPNIVEVAQQEDSNCHRNREPVAEGNGLRVAATAKDAVKEEKRKNKRIKEKKRMKRKKLDAAKNIGDKH